MFVALCHQGQTAVGSMSKEYGQS